MRPRLRISFPTAWQDERRRKMAQPVTIRRWEGTRRLSAGVINVISIPKQPGCASRILLATDKSLLARRRCEHGSLLRDWWRRWVMWAWGGPNSPGIISVHLVAKASVQTTSTRPIRGVNQGRASVHEGEDSTRTSCARPSIPRTSKGGLGGTSYCQPAWFLARPVRRAAQYQARPALHLF